MLILIMIRFIKFFFHILTTTSDFAPMNLKLRMDKSNRPFNTYWHLEKSKRNGLSNRIITFKSLNVYSFTNKDNLYVY